MPVRWSRLGAATALWLALLCLGVAAKAADVAQLRGHADARASADFDVYLPPRNGAELKQMLIDVQDPGSVRYHRWLTPSTFAAQFGPDPATVVSVTAELAAHGMTVTSRSTQSLHVRASAAAVETAFATRLSRGRFADGSEEVVAEAPLSLTDALAKAGASIPQFVPVRHRQVHSRVIAAAPQGAAGPNGPYYTADLRQAYDFPDATALNGTGVAIGILMQGAYNARDIRAYFTAQGLAPPPLSTIAIDGGAPYARTTSIETHLDIQQAAGMAPGAAVVLYNVKALSDADLQQALTRINADNAVDLVNMSFGEPEAAFEPRYNGGVDLRPQMQTYGALFAQGTLQGITFVASSGDFGSRQVVGKALVLSVSHPASDPNVTAVGGTNLVTAHGATGAGSVYVRENASDDPFETKQEGAWGSGGGVSMVFAQPAYQASVVKIKTAFRTLPDVALHMGGCPADAKQPCGADRSADYVMIGGKLVGVIGTSAAAPDMVGLLALKVALGRGGAAAPVGRLGNANADIYAKLAAQLAGGPAVYRHTGIPGTNGKYATRSPYDLVIGAGTVDARQFLGVMSLPAAGDPGTPGNP